MLFEGSFRLASVLAVTAITTPAQSVITPEQGFYSSSGPQGTTGLTHVFMHPLNAVRKGDLIYLAMVATPQSVTLGSIGDTQGNDYFLPFDVTPTPSPGAMGVAYAIAKIDGIPIIDIAITPFTSLDVHGLIYSGVDPNTPIDETGSGDSSAASTTDMGCTLTTNTPGELVVSFMASAGANTAVPPAVNRSNQGDSLVADELAALPGNWRVDGITSTPPWYSECIALVPAPIPNSDGGTSTGDAGTTQDGGVGRDGGTVAASADRGRLISDVGCSSAGSIPSLVGLFLALSWVVRRAR